MSLDIYFTTAPCDHCKRGGEELFTTNITHNLYPMWSQAGIGSALYDSQGKRARDILSTLEGGLEYMRANVDACRKLDSQNGWGTYKDALPWLEDLVAACRRFPDAVIRISK